MTVELSSLNISETPPPFMAIPEVRASINNLPPELLSQVFRVLCDSFDILSIELNPMCPDAQVHILRNVSKLFRDITDADRNLWSRISLAHNVPLIDDSDVEITEGMVARWFALACGNGLEPGLTSLNQTLSFHYRTRSSDYPTEADKLAIRYLNGHSQHWRHASFDVPAKILQYFAYARGRMENLESLNFSIVEPCGPVFMGRVTAFEIAPKLDTLRCVGIWEKSPVEDVIVKLPWEQIINVDVVERNPLDFYHIMQLATSAIDVEVRPVSLPPYCHETRHPELPLLELPALTTLGYLTHWDYTLGEDTDYRKEEGGLFGYLVLPGVHSLLIEDAWESRSCKAAVGMLERSRSEVNHLTLTGPGSGESWINDCMLLVEAVSGTLTSLRVESFRYTTDAIQMIKKLAEGLDDWEGGRLQRIEEIYVEVGVEVYSQGQVQVYCPNALIFQVGDLMSSVCERNAALDRKLRLQLVLKSPESCLIELREEWSRILDGRYHGEQVEFLI
ncbi:hypothetical protein PM082_009789 [Marasmius tenuissimus]|nr:hypothetical protein PM082_009789 [Marasmius tenuissimus]